MPEQLEQPLNTTNTSNPATSATKSSTPLSDGATPKFREHKPRARQHRTPAQLLSRLFGGYVELLRIPYTLRFVIAAPRLTSPCHA